MSARAWRFSLLTAIWFGWLSWAMNPAADAQQVRINDQILGRGGNTPIGIRVENSVWSFHDGTSDRYAPTVLGILTPPQSEPIEPSRSGAMWVFCAQGNTSTSLTCALKVNVFGTVLEVSSGTWESTQ